MVARPEAGTDKVFTGLSAPRTNKIKALNDLARNIQDVDLVRHLTHLDEHFSFSIQNAGKPKIRIEKIKPVMFRLLSWD